MARLDVCLFGKFSARRGAQEVEKLDAYKVQELFCYLLLHRARPHSREALAGLLWGDSPTVQSKKYLRQGLWQLQSALEYGGEPAGGRVLVVEPEWVQLNLKSDLLLDVAEFEQACALVQGKPGQEIDEPGVQALRYAAALYRGDLLEGWYQDWCLYERERLQNMYLAVLDKLMSHCEGRLDYEGGIVFGTQILYYDRARERTHRLLMRLYYLAGDRTAALRQYDRCLAALDEELGVKPSKQTAALYEQIRADQLEGWAATQPGAGPLPRAGGALTDVVGRLKQVWARLANMQRQIEQDLKAIEVSLNDRR